MFILENQQKFFSQLPQAVMDHFAKDLGTAEQLRRLGGSRVVVIKLNRFRAASSSRRDEEYPWELRRGP